MNPATPMTTPKPASAALAPSANATPLAHARLAREWMAILGTAFALRALVALALLRAMPMVSDAASYVDFALDLLSGAADAKPYYWPPGNSMVIAGVIALFGNSAVAVRLMMIALGVGGVALSSLLARELTRDPRAAPRAGWIGALYAPAVLLAGQSYAQHLAAFTVAAVAYFALVALRRANVLAGAIAGFAFSLGCLTRPSLASVAPVIVIAFIVCLRPRGAPRARLAIAGAAFALVSAVCVMPAVLHNARLGAGSTISTNNERNFFLGNNPYTPDYKTSHLGQRGLDELEPATRAYLESFYVRQDARAAMQKEALAFIAHHPLTTAYRSLNRATSFWGFDYLGARIIQEDRGWGKKGLLPLLAIEAGSYIVVMVLALVAVFAMKRESDTFARRWLLAIALAYELPYVIAFSGGTYHFPVMPIAIAFAGVGFDAVRAGADSFAREFLRGHWKLLIAIGAFAIVQVQYAYYAIALAG